MIFCDNKATVAMTKNLRTKHIDVLYHFIRSLIGKVELLLKFCGTNEQEADILTKLLPQAKHDYFRLKPGVFDFETRGSVE